MKKRAFITGGNGFVGSHLVEFLEKKKYQVAIFDIKEPEGFSFKGKFYKGDILNHSVLEKAIVAFKPGVIFDCCGVLGTAETFEHIQKAIDVNIKGTINALDIAREHGIALIYIGLTNKWFNPYTITKRAAEKFCLMYAKEFGMKVAVLKGLNVYGQRQHWKKVRKIAPTFITLALENKPLIINGSGNQVVDFIHARDLAKMIVRMYEMGTCWGKSIDGGSGIPLTVNDAAKNIIRLAKSESKIIYKRMRRGEPEISVTLANPAAVQQLLNFYPEISLEEGLKETIEWYRKNYKTFDKN